MNFQPCAYTTCVVLHDNKDNKSSDSHLLDAMVLYVESFYKSFHIIILERLITIQNELGGQISPYTVWNEAEITDCFNVLRCSKKIPHAPIITYGYRRQGVSMLPQTSHLSFQLSELTLVCPQVLLWFLSLSCSCWRVSRCCTWSLPSANALGRAV